MGDVIEMGFEIALPDGWNGVGEFGIAAGADDVSAAKYQLIVLQRAEKQTLHAGAMPKELADSLDVWNSCENAKKHSMANRSTIVTRRVLEWLGFSSADEIPAKHTVDKDDQGVDIEVETLVPWIAGTLAVNVIDHGETEITRWYAQSIVFLIESGWMCGRQGNKNVSWLDGAQSADLIASRKAEIATGAVGTVLNPVSKITKWLEVPRVGTSLATIIISAKISWFLTNHHVGQNPEAILSYAGKVVALDDVLARTTQSTLRLALWAIGKYCVTIPVLESCGLGGLLQVNPGGADRDIGLGLTHVDAPYGTVNFTVSADVTLRMSSRPAGTAAQMTHLAIAEHAAVSHYAVLIPEVGQYDDWVAAKDAIKANAARYHMGSFFLTGLDRITLPAVQEDSAMNLAGYIHAVAPSGHLAKAPVISRIDEIKGTTVYTMICSVKAELTTMSTDAVLKKLMTKTKRGGGVGGFAKQKALISEQDVRDARAEVEVDKAAAAAAVAAGGAASLAAV